MEASSPHPGVRIGVDLGGTKIEAVALRADGTVAARKRIPTPAGNAGQRIAAIVGLVDAIEAELGVRATVGIGTPGALSPATGLLRNANSTCFNGLALDRLLAEALARPVRIANDANCFALSEATDGAGSADHVVFGVILGTGVGGGIVVGGRLLTGRHAIAGEWGHNPMPWLEDDERPGPSCYCGKHGCIETFLSGPAMAADHQRHSGEHRTTHEIVAAAESGEPASRATLARYTDRLARALAGIINLLDPDVIVLGGGLSNLAALYEEVPRLWRRHVFSDAVTTRLARALHGDSSGVRGAAWLWPDAAGKR